MNATSDPTSAFAAARHTRLYHRLQLAAHAVHRRSDRAMLAGAGLTTAQVAVLTVLTEAGPSSQRAIAARLGVNEPAVTEMVRRLVAAGCVSKEVDPGDARARVVALTDHGRSLLPRTRPPFATVNQDFAAALTAEEIELLAGLLDRIHAQFTTGAAP